MHRTNLRLLLGRMPKIQKIVQSQTFKTVWTSWTFSDFLDFVRCGLVRTFGRASIEASKSSNPGNVQGQIASCVEAYAFSPLDQKEDGRERRGRHGHFVLTVEESGRRFACMRADAVRRLVRTYRYGAIFKTAVRPRSLIRIGAGTFDQRGSARHG